ncbi:MAG: hypothetical protein OEV78_10115 [Spirochaetia bacterium]|nr:hypothetical protein [Spirochaetia bacterium]
MWIQEVFKSLNPIGERKINLDFSANPVGKVKAFENLVEQSGNYIEEILLHNIRMILARKSKIAKPEPRTRRSL